MMKNLGPKHFGLLLVAIVAVSSGTTYAILEGVSVQPTINNGVQLLGHVEIVVSDAQGNIKAYRQSDNMIVTDGMELLAENLFSTVNASSAKISHMEIGTGGETAPAAGQTDIITVISSCAREVASFSSVNGTMNGSPNANVTATATFEGGNVGPNDCDDSSIDEAAIFNHATGGEMFARNTFTAVELTADDTLALTWTFQFTDT